jgi:hypothetical protein
MKMSSFEVGICYGEEGIEKELLHRKDDMIGRYYHHCKRLSLKPRN